MHRTQVYLEDRQHVALKARARREGRTMAAVLRDVIDRGLGPGEQADPLDGVIGIGQGDGSAVAENCDEFLYGDGSAQQSRRRRVKR